PQGELCPPEDRNFSVKLMQSINFAENLMVSSLNHSQKCKYFCERVDKIDTQNYSSSFNLS
ncbi:MAG: hypothetical protein LUC92_09780, partial [Clostridiales bacterium]|nr:hypothetical protein [Clostridiales bacterium]